MHPIKLIQGNCLEALDDLPDESVDAVITDPPYLKEYLPLYWQLSERLKRVLKPGGSLLAIVPHYGLPEVLREVGKHLKYRWTCAMWQASGSHPRLSMGIEVMWKPIVWWVKDAWPKGRGFIRDGFENTPVEKKFHKWEQSLDWAYYCLKFVPEGGVVLDPFMGGGTVGVACKDAGYPFIGIELDKDSFEKASRRINEFHRVGAVPNLAGG